MKINIIASDAVPEGTALLMPDRLTEAEKAQARSLVAKGFPEHEAVAMVIAKKCAVVRFGGTHNQDRP